MGCMIDIAINGEEAVSMNNGEVYDIIFMDCMMPVMDGFLATALIRVQEKSNGKHTTIIAMTANVMKGDRDHCLACGMDDYISKPIRPEAISDMLVKWLQKDPVEATARKQL